MKVLVEKAEKQMNEGNYIKALEYYREFNIETNKREYFEGKEKVIRDSFFNIAVCTAKIGRFPEALKMFQELNRNKETEELKEIIKVLGELLVA